MNNPDQFSERRKYTRFQVKDRSFALNTKFGPVVDISLDGLTFLHAPSDRDVNIYPEAGVLFAGKTPVCDKLPVKVINEQVAGGGSSLLRRGGLQFGDLTQEQLSQLESCIVKGQKWDLKKIKPTYEDLAARVKDLERVVIKLKEKKKTEKKQELEKFLNDLADQSKTDSFLLICSYCKNIKDDQDKWLKIEKFAADHFDVKFSHGICPGCSKKHYPHLFEPEE